MSSIPELLKKYQVLYDEANNKCDCYERMSTDRLLLNYEHEYWAEWAGKCKAYGLILDDLKECLTSMGKAIYE